jgi:uncharacterized protein
MRPTSGVVHLELRTRDVPRACTFLGDLFAWRVETVRAGPIEYLALAIGSGIEGGLAEVDAAGALWLPYVEVDDVRAATERALDLGACLTLDLREGPVGWRTIVETPASGPLGLWQPKR